MTLGGTCSFPQSHCISRLSGKKRLWRTRTDWSASARPLGTARASASACDAAATSAGSWRVERRGGGARARPICVVNASTSGRIDSRRRPHVSTSERIADGASIGATSCAASSCSLVTVSCTAADRRSPCE